jgi:hypothetical protein
LIDNSEEVYYTIVNNTKVQKTAVYKDGKVYNIICNIEKAKETTVNSEEVYKTIANCGNV